MKMTKRVGAWALLLVVGFVMFAPTALAQDAGSASDVAEYAAREAGSQGLERFAGGYVGALAALGLLAILPTVVVALLVVAIGGLMR